MSDDSSSEVLQFTVDFPAMRIDKALSLAWSDISRVQWQRLLKDERVSVNGKIISKLGYKLAGGEEIIATLPPVETSEMLPEDLPIDILYEDSELIVVNKVAGMVVHPAFGTPNGTLANAILHHCPDLQGVGGEKRPGIVHRLDKNTSGVMVIAKNDQSLRHIQQQFKDRTVHKLYIALVEGHPQQPRAMIDAPIGRDPKNRKQMAVIPPSSSAMSREAQTTYEVIKTVPGYSLIRCILHTGRTHQIRVHMAYIRHPLVGDTIYGRNKQRLLTTRHFLHAAELGFIHPTTGEKMAFQTELPTELADLYQQLLIQSY